MTKSRYTTARTARGLHAHWLYWCAREREAAQIATMAIDARCNAEFKRQARTALQYAKAARTALPDWRKLPD